MPSDVTALCGQSTEQAFAREISGANSGSSPRGSSEPAPQAVRKDGLERDNQADLAERGLWLKETGCMQYSIAVRQFSDSYGGWSLE